MEKKEVKKITISETIIKHLSSGSDCSGEWETNATIDFLLSEPFKFQVFCDEYLIDRIRLFCDWNGVSLHYANEEDHYHSIIVSKIFIKKVFDELTVVQREEQFKQHDFRDDLMDMLRGDREVSNY